MNDEKKLSLSPAGFDITPPHISPKRLDITPPHQTESVSPPIEEKSIDTKQKSPPNKSLQESEDAAAKNNNNEGISKIKEVETAKSNEKEEKIEEESISDDQKEKSKPIGEFFFFI
jgi:hypothetical protein